MGALLQALSDPGVLSLALAGMSRDPESPERALRSFQITQAEMEKQQQRQANLEAIKAYTQGLQSEIEPGMDLSSLGKEISPEMSKVYSDYLGSQARSQQNHLKAILQAMGTNPNIDPSVLMPRLQMAEQTRNRLQEYPIKLMESVIANRAKKGDMVTLNVGGKEVEVPSSVAIASSDRAASRQDAMERHEENKLDRQERFQLSREDRLMARQQAMQIHQDNMDMRKQLAEMSMGLRQRIPAQKAKEITEKQQTIDRYNNLIQGFKDNYAGSKIAGPTMTNVYERLGANKPRVNWWKDFRWMDNQLRHDIFGATLTGYEKQSWDNTTVSENTDPNILKGQLEKRLQYAQNALLRELEGYQQAGYTTGGLSVPEKGQGTNPQQPSGRFKIIQVK